MPLLFNFFLEYAIKQGPRKSGRTGTEWNTHISSWSKMIMLICCAKSQAP